MNAVEQVVRGMSPTGRQEKMLGQRRGHCGDREEERKDCRARPPLTFNWSMGDQSKKAGREILFL